jgi:ParB-like chromosome segregation protein Spo0J
MNIGTDKQLSLTDDINEFCLENFGNDDIFRKAKELFEPLKDMPLGQRVECINNIRLALKEYSPFKNEPVDCVQWKKNEEVHANDYNPNSVAPPEMELLRLSIMSDGYTQPIVSWSKEDKFEVVDGFHRSRVGRECEDVKERVHGYVPLVVIKDDRQGQNDRMASTIRHNRARGKHSVDSMSDIVLELKRRNWSPKKIGKELGMDQDEVLRLVQITGLAEVFADHEFTEAWEAVELNDSDFDGEVEALD